MTRLDTFQQRGERGAGRRAQADRGEARSIRLFYVAAHDVGNEATKESLARQNDWYIITR